MTSIAWVLLVLLILSTASLIFFFVVFVKFAIRLSKAIDNLPKEEQTKFAEIASSKFIKVKV